MSTYSDKLRDPRWQKKRLEVMQRDNFRCIDCTAKEKPLNVHHCYYVTGRDVWDYPMYSLKTVCEDCHAKYKVKIEDEDSNQSELESGVDMFLGGRPDTSPALWEIGLLIDALRNTHGVCGFDLDRAMMDGLLRFWEERRGEEKPPIWMSASHPAPWLPQWYIDKRKASSP